MLTAVLVENVVDLLLDSLTVILTLGTALALAIFRNVDKGVTMHVVDSHLNSPQTAWGLQRVVYLEARVGESPSQVAQSLQRVSTWSIGLSWCFLGASSEAQLWGRVMLGGPPSQLALCPSLAGRTNDRVNSTSGITYPMSIIEHQYVAWKRCSSGLAAGPRSRDIRET